jgi:hypothetical protein
MRHCVVRPIIITVAEFHLEPELILRRERTGVIDDNQISAYSARWPSNISSLWLHSCLYPSKNTYDSHGVNYNNYWYTTTRVR